MKDQRCFQKMKFVGVDPSALGTLSLSETTPFCDNGNAVFPGFCVVHVHFREPGFSYKETIFSGSRAAARGGYTTVCTMPNLNPVPDTLEHLKLQLDLIERDSCIRTVPYGSITVGQMGESLSEMDLMAPYVCAFSDDGKGVQSDEMMEKAMRKAKSLGKMIVAHCEVNDLLKGGYIHDGEYARRNGHRGICSASEYEQIRRDLELVQKTDVSYHVCHISTKESVSLIREAKKAGIDVTCETGPHYLVLNDMDLKEDGKFKMNPPIRSEEDRLALLEGILDGTIDMIATDHAPHSAEEKSKGLMGSAFGIVGLETAFSLLYTKLVKEKLVSLEKLIDLFSLNPKKRFGFQDDQSFTVWNLNQKYTVDPHDFLSAGKATPFEGKELFASCLLTVCNNKKVYQNM